MTRWVAVTTIVGLLVGLLVGFLWWGRPLQRLTAELTALQGQQAAADAARERIRSLESELKAERERRQNLESALSQGRK